ncbi:cobalt ECF transporter T component CbiQ [Methanothermobacter sp. KEPCO 2]|uniref:cobalt ECF transporter T component CbiQ n=1 Tax=Methanothermobacter sp. KEPCO 2 TaxID=3240977 RepID=UPI003516F1A9
MNISVDHYAHTNGLRNMSPGFKMALAIITMLISVLSPNPVMPLIIAFLMTLLILFAADIPTSYYLRFAAIPVGFGVLTLVLMALFFGVNPLVTFMGLTVYSDGLHTGILVFSRILGGFSCLAFLALTTPLNEVFHELGRLGLPAAFIEIALLMYRSIFVFLEEASVMYNAQDSRLGYSGIKNSYRSLGLLAGNLFIRSWLRGETVYRSMEARCYQGTMPSIRRQSIGTREAVMIALFDGLLLVGLLFTSKGVIF